MQRRAFLAAALSLPALRHASAQAALPVVASFSILGDLVRQVAGERSIDLSVFVGPDGDAHDFQPRPSDAERLRGAALLVQNGLGYDGWLGRLTSAAGFRGVSTSASTGVRLRPTEGGHDHGHAHGTARRGQVAEPAADPHAWGDPRNGQVYLRNIAAGFSAADPGNAALYARNAETASARLATLDAEIRAAIATVPEARRKVLTSHDAFGYFGDAYGIRFLAPQGVSTHSEPSAAQVGALIRRLRAEGITAVFVENMSSTATLERLAREAGVRVRGRLYADALSPPDGPAPTYEALFRHNTGLIVPAMRGND
ncbi:metal ABC transporter solute-binding protein, Zn/Mn family [Roseomonas xinghualingensis]|uniref:metal ABC transporter solute-binding protein, Zn/Mn family n=1 Tax=Roseomonas xinghualingensis TaxID=2986475 RepID=UPI0021F0F883|nr:zinc ABC transporter substrate-binding protein [Roseomonas sp. SXEYE001]MCV4209638.1 zinc ABC transporter substrate-binding protein [Roseomonas sp. SXEYE001]